MRWRVGYFTCLFLIGLAVSGQTPSPGIFDLPAGTMSLSAALNDLRDQGAGLSYRPDQIPSVSVTIPPGERSLEAWLSLLLVESGLTVTRGSAGLIVLPDFQLRSRQFNAFGMVSDAISGERLIGATLQFTDTHTGTYTNEYGFYSLPAAGGRHKLRATYVGYQPLVLDLYLARDTQISLQLLPNNELPQIIVTAMESPEGEGRYYETGTRIGNTEVAQLGGPMGEDDPLQLARLLPGVTSGAEGIGGMLIRGSEAGHNLVLLDGVPVYGLSHAGGLFGIFSNQAIRRIDLYKDALPARFGGRIGGVLDVHTRDGNLYENELTVGSSLLSAQVVAEGPIRTGESSFLLTGRYFWAGSLIRQFSQTYKANRGRRGSMDYDVYDINVKLNQRAGEKGRLYFSLYSGLDDFANGSWESDTLTRVNEAGTTFTYLTPTTRRESIRWGNTVAALRYNHVFSERTFGNFRLSYSDLQTASSFERSDSLKTLEEQVLKGYLFSGNYRSQIRQFGLAFDGQHSLADGRVVRFGAEITDHRFIPALYTDTLSRDGAIPREGPAVFKPRQLALYGSVDGRFRNVFYRFGIRSSYWADPTATYLSFSPRILLAGPLTPKLDWQLSYDRTVQPIHLLGSFVIGLPSDLWVPSTEGLRPARSPQFSGKLTYAIAKDWSAYTSVYHKNMRGLIAYAEGQQSSDRWKDELSHGSGRAYGWESSVQRNRGRLRGWLSYTLARSERTFDRITNQGRTFPFRYDRRHSVNLLLIYQLGERTTITGSWRFESGLAYSFSEATIPNPQDGGQSNIPIYTERNGFRMPANHRLDLNLHTNISGEGSHFSHAIDLGLYNVYNRHNPVYYETRPEYTLDESGPVGQDRFYKIFVAPVLPTLSYHLTFSTGSRPSFGR